MATITLDKTKHWDEINKKLTEIREWFSEKDIPFLGFVGLKTTVVGSETGVVMSSRHTVVSHRMSDDLACPDVFKIMYATYASEFLRTYIEQAMKNKVFRDTVQVEIEGYLDMAAGQAARVRKETEDGE